jgi:hypothetical protein
MGFAMILNRWGGCLACLPDHGFHPLGEGKEEPALIFLS